MYHKTEQMADMPALPVTPFWQRAANSRRAACEIDCASNAFLSLSGIGLSKRKIHSLCMSFR
jgi:hypothetical protein